MKELFKTLLLILLITLFAATVFAESSIVKFSDPTKPGLLKTIGNGNVTITGYSGSDVVIDIESGVFVLVTVRIFIDYLLAHENDPTGHIDTEVGGFLQLVGTSKLPGFGNQGPGNCRLHLHPSGQFRSY